MAIIILTRQKDFMIVFRALKIYVNNEFVDYFEPKEKVKEFKVEDNAEIKVKVDWCSSNIVKITEDPKKSKQPITISSQIHNGLFVLIFGCFITGNILMILDNINPFAYLSLISPMSIIVWWQTFGKKNYLRLTKVSKQEGKFTRSYRWKGIWSKLL